MVKEKAMEDKQTEIGEEKVILHARENGENAIVFDKEEGAASLEVLSGPKLLLPVTEKRFVAFNNLLENPSKYEELVMFCAFTTIFQVYYHFSII